MIKVMIVGQKWLAEQLLKYCIVRQDIQVVAVSPPSIDDRLAVLASQHNIPVNVHGKMLKQTQIPIEVDIILTAHAYCFVTGTARSKARYGAVGYHPSLLPKYKGKSAIVDTINAGEKVTGGSLYQLDNGWDTGKVIMQDEVAVDSDDTALTLWKNKLAPLGLVLFEAYLDTMNTKM